MNVPTPFYVVKFLDKTTNGYELFIHDDILSATKQKLPHPWSEFVELKEIKDWGPESELFQQSRVL